MDKEALKANWKKVWHFIWEDESIYSWLVNVALAFILIKFIVYPGLGLMLGTSYPVVAVVSGSMEHKSSFDEWWQNSPWYPQNGITKEQFANFKLRDGFNKGDIIILWKANRENIEVGDIIVFRTAKPDPIIHRVVHKWEEGDNMFYTTKGDNFRTNPKSIKDPLIDETRIGESQIIGKAAVKIPLLGYIKIWFVSLITIMKAPFA